MRLVGAVRGSSVRWICGGRLASVTVPVPGWPPFGWVAVRDGVPGTEWMELEQLAQACSAECVARILVLVRERLIGMPWQPPDEPGPTQTVADLMYAPGRR